MRKSKVADTQVALFEDLPILTPKGDRRVIKALEARERDCVVPKNFIMVESLAQVRECVAEVRAAKLCSIDTETTGIHWFTPDFRVTAIGVYANSTGWIIPHFMLHAPLTLDKTQIQDELGDIFEDPEIAKIFAYAQFDRHAIRRTFDIQIGGTKHDVVLAGWILDENVRHGIEPLAEMYLGQSGWKIKQDGNFHMWPKNMATLYLGHDIETTMALYRFQLPNLEAQPKLYKLMYEIEQPHQDLLYRMEQRGVAWDQDYFDEFVRPEIDRHYEQAVAAIRAYPGMENINPASPQQLSKVLFDGLGLRRINMNSVDKRVLSHLKGEHPIIEDLEHFSKYATLKKNFVNKLPRFVVNGRIYTSFAGIGARTGRLAAKNPNLQNIPKAAIGPLIRKSFIPSPGYVLVTLDYSQIELRILAHLANDQAMIDAFVAGHDFHTVTAHRMSGLSMAELEADKDLPQRVVAKNVNFGIPYGIGGVKLVDTVNILLSKMGVDPSKFYKEEQGNDLIDDWYAAYPEAAAYLQSQVDLYKDTGVVETIFGRKRRLYVERESGNWGIRASGERKARNAPIQGSSADLVKIAALALDKLIRENHWPYTPLLSIHDELIFEVPIEWLNANRGTLEQLKYAMEHCAELSVPLKVGLDILDRWGAKRPEEADTLEFDDEETEEEDAA